mmetsp:Transcript_55377/g.171569  ORF Transcript_55377/g.171569 Transcript_55377/m.171569 type:complete len:215 (-) Transcript_55377:200-844(-)
MLQLISQRLREPVNPRAQRTSKMAPCTKGPPKVKPSGSLPTSSTFLTCVCSGSARQALLASCTESSVLLPLAPPLSFPRWAAAPPPRSVPLDDPVEEPLESLTPPAALICWASLVSKPLEDEVVVTSASGCDVSHWSPWIHLNASKALLGQSDVQPAAVLSEDAPPALRSKQAFLSNRCVCKQHGASRSEGRNRITKQQPRAPSPRELLTSWDV